MVRLKHSGPAPREVRQGDDTFTISTSHYWEWPRKDNFAGAADHMLVIVLAADS
jgi:hypothetical protein